MSGPSDPSPTPLRPGADREVRRRRDRTGREHIEGSPDREVDEPRMRRVADPLESAWRDPSRRAQIAAAALAMPNPRIDPDPEAPGQARWSWVVDAPDATAVALWTNAVFDHRDVAAAEFLRLPDSSLWTICLELPAALRTSYRIAVWREAGPPPWRTAVGRRAVLLAALAASEPDPRGRAALHGADDHDWSIGAGPDAPAEVWQGLPARRPSGSRTDLLTLLEGERAWVYSPGEVGAPTPLLVLFDGQVWHGMGLADQLDALIAARRLPPLHVAMLDSGDPATRWERLGVPGGQVDTVLDALLPRLRSGWAVDPSGASTLVAGQSLGGLSALWTVALGEGGARGAIAQSPSLWRFPILDALLDRPLPARPGWDRIVVQAGVFEPDMLLDAQELAAALTSDVRLGERRVRMEIHQAGHDWAPWRANLLHALHAELTGD